MSSSVKQQFLQDMQLAGLAPNTQKVYLGVVLRFVRRSGTRPQHASEQQVARYLRELVERGCCHGTIATARYGLQFIFANTLGRDWGVFKKKSPPAAANACPRPPAMPMSAASWPPSAVRFTGSASA